MIYSILYYDGFYTWTDFLSQDTKILSPVEVNTWTQINKQFYYTSKLWFQEMHVDSEIPLKATRKHLARGSTLEACIVSDDEQLSTSCVHILTRGLMI